MYEMYPQDWLIREVRNTPGQGSAAPRRRARKQLVPPRPYAPPRDVTPPVRDER